MNLNQLERLKEHITEMRKIRKEDPNHLIEIGMQIDHLDTLIQLRLMDAKAAKRMVAEG